ncbi:MAG: hypothetical protein JJU02_10705 [Cryomorphaceae bacterium]|nr:hypothetical protein [Cryomorphaceae bacterium]
MNLVYFDLGQGEDYVYYGYTEFKGINRGDTLQLGSPQKKRFRKEYPKDLFPEYYIIKVNKFNDIAKSPLDEWIYYFKNSELPAKCDEKTLSLLSQKLVAVYKVR